MKGIEKKKKLETRIKYLVTGMIFGVSLIGLLFFSAESLHLYNQEVTSHLRDSEELIWENISALLDEVDDLSVRILSDETIQSNLITMKEEASDNRSMKRLREGAIATIRSRLRTMSLTARHVYNIRIYPLQGESFSYETNFSGQIDDLPEEEIYQKNGGALWIASSDYKYIYLARAILDMETMEPLGYMVILYQNQYLCNYLESLNTPFSGNIYLVSAEGEMIAAPDYELVGSDFSVELSQNERISSITQDPVTGQKCYYYAERIMENGWTMVITVASENVWKRLRINLLLVVGISLFILFAGIWISSKAIRKTLSPASELQKTIQAFGDGDLNARMKIRNMDELGQISQGYNQMADKIQNLLEQVYSLEIANREAEIDFLKMQINPHFLYNTLDTISWLGFQGGNEDVSNLAVSLAKLLRYSLSQEDYVTVSQELDSIRDYLEIQEYRFRDRFEMILEVDPEAEQLYMPKFLLQPLVENSIIHGLENMIGKGRFALKIRKRSEYLYFSVEDNGVGMSYEVLNQLMEECRDIRQTGSIGLKNVYRRLYLLYGSKTEFSISSELQKGTRITFLIPVQEKSD